MAQLTLLDLVQTTWINLQAGQLPPSSVLTLLLSKALGFAILAFSCVVKVPQILAVAQSKSAEGLAPISFELEQIGLSIHTAYGWLLQLPFNTYGEAAIICVQNTFLLAQIYIFSKAPLWRSALLTTLLALAASALLTGRISEDTIKSAYDFNNVIFLAARLPQIYQNYKAGGTGQLSIITAFANLAGCLARIFTSLQEEAGTAMVRGYLVGTVLNGTIFAQIVYYNFIRSPKSAASKSKVASSTQKPAAKKKL